MAMVAASRRTAVRAAVPAPLPARLAPLPLVGVAVVPPVVDTTGDFTVLLSVSFEPHALATAAIKSADCNRGK